MVPTQDEITGTLLASRYQIGQCLRKNELQRLYKAQDTATGAAVHCKVFYPAKAADEQFRNGFAEQFQRITAIAHPNVLIPSDFGFYNDQPYIITPSFAGVSIREAISMDGPFTLERVCDLAEQIADALGAGHAAGVIHGYLSSNSIALVGGFSESEQAYILDFGISHFFTASDTASAMTDSGKLIGEPEYLAPEQVRGLPTDAATDIYSLACVIYELLTGEVPFRQTIPGAEGVMDVLMRQANDPPPDLPESLSLPEEVHVALKSALQKEPSDRPQTVALFIRRFAEASSELSSEFSLPPSEGEILIPTNDRYSQREHNKEQASQFAAQAQPEEGFQSIDAMFSQPPESKMTQGQEDDQSESVFDSPVDSEASLSPESEAQNPWSSFDQSEPEESTDPSRKKTEVIKDRAAYDWLAATDESGREVETPDSSHFFDQEPATETPAPEQPMPTQPDFEEPLSEEPARAKPDTAVQEVDEFDQFSQEGLSDINEEDPQRHGDFETFPELEAESWQANPEQSSPSTRDKNALIRKLVIPLIGITIVACVVVVVGLLSRSRPEPIASVEQDGGSSMVDVDPQEQALLDAQENDNIDSPDESENSDSVDEVAQDIASAQGNEGTETDSPSSGDENLRYGKVNLEDMILASKAGKALAAEYEKAYRAVGSRANKKLLMDELHTRMTEAVREIRLDLEAVVEQYARRNGFGLVVGKNESLNSTVFVLENLDAQSFAEAMGTPIDISQDVIDSYDMQLAQ